MGFKQTLGRNNLPLTVTQHKLHLATYVIHTRLECHLTLREFTRDVESATILDKDRARLNKAEGYVIRLALLGESLHPIEITGACTVIVLTTCNNLLDLSRSEVILDIYRPDKGGCHNTFMLERQLQKQRNSLVSTTLILTRYVEEDIIPAIAPIFGQALSHTLGTLREKKKLHIATGFDYLPRLIAPHIGLIQKEVGRHAYTNQLATLNFQTAIAITLERIGKTTLRTKHLASIHSSLAIEEIHIAVLATLANLFASVPWIPNVVHCAILLYLPINAILTVLNADTDSSELVTNLIRCCPILVGLGILTNSQDHIDNLLQHITTTSGTLLLLVL